MGRRTEPLRAGEIEPSDVPSPDGTLRSAAPSLAARLRPLFAPVDVAPLVYTRIAFGVLMLVEVGRYFSHGWIRAYYIRPSFLFSYPGFGWIRPLPSAGMYGVFVALGALSVLIALGLAYRAAAALFALGITYVFLLDQTHYLNHLYLICLFSFLLACVPAASAGSLDARIRRRSEETAPAWTLWLLRGQIAIAYFFGGVAKIDGDWLSGQPGAAFLDSWEVTAPLAEIEIGRRGFALAGLLFDLLIVPALLWRRTRWIATGAAVVFHLTNSKLFEIGIFPWLMLGLIPLFWPPELVRRLLARARILRHAALEPGSAEAPLPRRALWIAGALGAYGLFQVLFPLRHWLYPGEVNWTEQGHNFSWHMKLRVKRGKAVFIVRDPATGETWEEDPRDHLTARQVRKMSTRPEMIRQFAHELARRYAALSHPDLEIRARVMVSLNGRRRQHLVDPNVDLARVRWTVGAAPWIVPLGSAPVAREARGSDEDD